MPDGGVVIDVSLNNRGMEKDVRRTVATLTAQYRRAGMSQSEAMKKAWSEVEHTSKKSAAKVRKHIQSMGDATKEVSGKLGGLKTVLGKVGILISTAFAARQIIQFGTEAVKAANEATNALTGLKSVVEGQGRSFAAAQGFIEEYTKDGLIPATNAITAYKNLALRGYDDSQIRQVLVALKDSAAFGRQSSYTMGEAVQSAAEGLKNENSILVDNAGVTKNVAKMWDEYARSIGTTANNLTQQQKIQAEVNGILEESKYQAGDAAKVAGTFSGQLMQLSFNFNNLKVAVGNAIIPLAQKILPVINTIIAALTRLANAVATVMGAIFGKAKVTQNTQELAAGNTQIADSAGAGAAAEKDLAQNTKKAGKAAKGALAAFDELNVLQQDTGGADPVSGSGAAGSGTPVSIPPIAAELEVEDTLSSRFLDMLDEINKMFLPSIEAWQRAFGQMKKSAGTAFESMGNSAMILWESSLEPFFDYVLTGFVPGIVNAFSEAAAPIAADVFGGGMEILASNFELACGIISSAVDDVLYPAFQLIEQAFGDMMDSVSEAWALYGRPIVDGTVEMAGKVRQIIAALWYGLLLPLLEDLQDQLTTLWEEHLKPLWDNVALFFGALWELFLTFWNGVLLPKIQMLMDVFLPLIKSVLSTIIQLVFHILHIITDVINGVVQVLRGLCDFLVGVFTGDWDKAWEGVKEIFSGIWTAIVGIAKGAINGVIGLVNGMISAIVEGVNCVIRVLNKLKWDVPDWVPGLGGKSFGFDLPTFSAPQIPMLAQGAVLPANRPFLAMVGDQKNGTNIEAPLDTIKQALAEVLGQQGAQEIIIKFAASGGLEQLVRLLKPYIDRENDRVGATLITGGVY